MEEQGSGKTVLLILIQLPFDLKAKLPDYSSLMTNYVSVHNMLHHLTPPHIIDYTVSFVYR